MKKKIALVTGSSRGIGREIILELACSGYDAVANSSVNDNDLNEVEYCLMNAGVVNPLVIKADISKEDEVQSMILDVIKRYGKIDLLVNNAGIVMDTMITEMTVDEWNKVIETNLTGAFFCCREVLRSMRPNKSGKIINIASVVGQTGNIGQCNYAASKGGIIALTKSLAKEYARYGILVNAIAPGFIETEMLDHIPRKVLKHFVDQIPLGHLGKPSDVAKLVGFLASEDANYITGQTINVNGGYYV